MDLVWDSLFLLPFICGFYLFIQTPLSVRYGAPEWTDSLFGSALTLITILYFYFTHFSAQMVPEGDTAPCGRLSRQRECYNLTEAICMAAWNSSEGDCENRMDAIRKARPSALTGSFLETCRGRNFDKIMHYNRKSETTPMCQSYFYRIDKKD